MEKNDIWEKNLNALLPSEKKRNKSKIALPKLEPIIITEFND
jgi:hypothetical protein